MFENIIAHINELSPVWIYLILFFFSFIENVFPPSPSDIVVVLGAVVLAQLSIVHFVPILVVTSFGSSIGFMLMYYVGKIFGEKIIRTGKLKFINTDSISRTDRWFARYGYKLILANRFLPGTRSVISFFSGFAEMESHKTFGMSTLSAFLWNTLIILTGFLLGRNIKLIDEYMSAYSNIALLVTGLVIVFIIIRYYLRKIKVKKN